VTPTALARILDRGAPDLPGPVDSPHSRAFFENSANPPACICRTLDSVGQNPSCDIHGWWTHDNAVLDLADLTRELGSAWDAAVKKFGGSA
jgi:hypothetical protein